MTNRVGNKDEAQANGKKQKAEQKQTNRAIQGKQQPAPGKTRTQGS